VRGRHRHDVAAGDVVRNRFPEPSRPASSRVEIERIYGNAFAPECVGVKAPGSPGSRSNMTPPGRHAYEAGEAPWQRSR
jgi:hypothetical protein